MLTDLVKNELGNLVSGTILWKESMQKHTTFHIGGAADSLILPSDENDLRRIIEVTGGNRVPLYVIGSGSNLLVSDEGIEGVVIKMAGCFTKVSICEGKITVGAGYNLSRLAKQTTNVGLGGLEFATGIPGTVGGAVVMNAGAKGMAVGDLVANVRIMDLGGEIRELTKRELNFCYRNSELQKGNAIVLEVEMELTQGNAQEIKKKAWQYLKERHRKLPLAYPSAGSIFKNPENDFAGRLIEACGCKGMRIGDAEVSKLHANFIVNRGNATAQDVLQLMGKVQGMVFKKYGIKLEPEIKILGRGIETIQETQIEP